MTKNITYRCSACDYVGHVVTQNKWDRRCEGCGEIVKTHKIIFKKHHNPKRTNYVDVMMDDRPRWSDAMGINPEQLPDFLKRYPDSTYDSEGRLLIKNRAHKIKEMSRRGYYD